MKSTALAFALLTLALLALAGLSRPALANCDIKDFFDKQAACARDCGDKKLFCREKYSSARNNEDCEASKKDCLAKCGC